jgi:hypothetical protein
MEKINGSCVSMGMERKVEGCHTIATPVSPRYPSSIPGEVLVGVLIFMESTGPGLPRIVRRIEVRDQSSGWTRHQGKHSVDYSAVLVISGCNVQFWEAGFSDGRGCA